MINFKLALKVYLVGFIIFLSNIIFWSDLVIFKCDYFGCGLALGLILFYIQLFLYIASVIYFVLLFLKPKLYRAILAVIMAILSFVAIHLLTNNLFEDLIADDPFFLWIGFLRTAVIYPSFNLFYYWLLNVWIPSIEAKQK